MPKSRITPSKEYGKDLWVVSVLNTVQGAAGLIDGHSAIVVEGVEPDGTPFIGQYDIAAAQDPTRETKEINTKGYISKIKCYENRENKRNYEKEKFPAESVYVEPAKAKAMITAIKVDAERATPGYENATSIRASGGSPRLDRQGQPYEAILYQRLGKEHWLVKSLGNPAAGDNCAGWCVEKLKIAEVDVSTPFPKPKVLPKKLACQSFFKCSPVKVALGVVGVAVAAAAVIYKT